MKKFMLILVVVFASCASPVDEPDVVGSVNPFEGRWMADNGYITVWSDNTIFNSTGTILGTYTYDVDYLYWWMTGNLSHIYNTYKYEFRDNGNELHLIFVPNVYSQETTDPYQIIRKIID